MPVRQMVSHSLGELKRATARKLTVLQVCEGLGPLHGGPGVDLPNYCTALARLGCGVHLLTTHACESDCSAAAGVIEETVDGFSACSFPCRWASRWRLSPGLARWLLRHAGEFDLIHLNSLYSFPTLVGATVARLRGIPHVVTLHGCLAPIQRMVSARKKAAYHALFVSAILNHAAAVICSAQREYTEISDLAIRAPCVLVHNGIGLEQFAHLPERGSFRQRFLAGSDDPLVLYLGRLNPKKGLDVLVEAFARLAKTHPSAKLAIVGQADPPAYQQIMKAWLHREQLTERVVMTGMLTGMDKLGALSDADLFVLPSRAENFGSAMFEAMACGLPVVVSSELAAAAEVTRYKAGLSVELSAEHLAQALALLIDDPDLRDGMGRNARVLAGQYTADCSAAELVRLYRNIIEAAAPQRWAIQPYGTREKI